MTLTVELLARCDWQDIIEAATEKHCHEFGRVLFHKAKAAETDGTACAPVYRLTSDIASLLLDLKDSRSPFRPEQQWNGYRTFAPSDLSDEQIAILREFAPSIRDAEMRARVCDLMWTLDRKQHELGKAAITAYRESTERLAVGDAPSLAGDNIVRATQIAALMGRNGAQYGAFITDLERLAEREDFHAMVIATIIDQLVEQRAGDATRLRSLAETWARRREAAQDFWKAREFWHLVERLSERAGDAEGLKEAKAQLAESFLTEAKALSNLNDPTTFAAVAHRLEHGLHALRRVEGTEERQREVHKQLLESQFANSQQMGRVSATTDISDAVQATRDQFRDVTSAEDALFTLALIARPPQVSRLRSEVEDAAKRFPLQHSIARVTVDRDGKPLAKRGSVTSSDEEERELAIRAQMASHANLHHSVDVQAGVLPGMDEIKTRFMVTEGHFARLIEHTPFVPDGHRQAFATGLYAGFEMRLIESAHILTNQLEAAIRHVLKSQGAITSKLSSEGIQENLLLNELLALPTAEETFGEDLRFDLQCLLVERFGSNLRNRLSHGLMLDAEFFTAEVVYLWWLTLRLCCLPLIAAKLERDQPSGSGSDGDDGGAKK